MGLMTSDRLAFLKAKALRHRIWFTLNRLERGVMDLTIRCVHEIKSKILALIIGRIVCKLLRILRSPFLAKVDRIGSRVAEIISRIAVNWGYTAASAWKHDRGFIRYLGVHGGSTIV